MTRLVALDGPSRALLVRSPRDAAPPAQLQAGAVGMRATILDLQRTAGNQAVASWLALQRCGDTPCGCPHEEQTAAQRQEDAEDAGDGVTVAEDLHPLSGADAEATYDGLDALQDPAGDQSDESMQLQRDGNGGGTAPVTTGVSCTTLTFADFQGRAPASPFAAQTAFNYVVRSGRIAAEMNRARSWVNRQRVALSGRTAQTTGSVRGCATYMRQPNAANYTVTPQPSATNPCAASDALRSPATATSVVECESVIGTQLDGEDQADAARLLRHEQYHMNLACAIASLGNDAIAQGTPVADVRSQVTTADQRLQQAYDNDTGHGCDAGAQSTWEGNIDSRSLAFP